MRTPPELLASIRLGDRDAFERFFRSWYAPLAMHAALILGNQDGAEDAVQEVFIAIWKRRESLPDAEKMPAYLHRAVRNRALNQLRGPASREGWSPEAALVSSATDTDTAMRENELESLLGAALAALAPRTREVFLLSRDQGRSYSEIAGILDISVKTVETLMGRALKSLRSRLGPELR